jgi:hypothetical protein
LFSNGPKHGAPAVFDDSRPRTASLNSWLAVCAGFVKLDEVTTT